MAVVSHRPVFVDSGKLNILRSSIIKTIIEQRALGDRTQLESAPNLSLLELVAKTATGTLDKFLSKKSQSAIDRVSNCR
ncbi:hypothetical protein [Microcoleus sp. D3_18_C4]|uniref:hypothetical protein n=1 Tax=Microcoleus sp. D3_18_C4 TaxID=3055335 RepID=UPI002FD5A2E7